MELIITGLQYPHKTNSSEGNWVVETEGYWVKDGKRLGNNVNGYKFFWLKKQAKKFWNENISATLPY